MSFPTYSVSSEAGPGLLYVNSKITDSALSQDIFTEWYGDVHIPDIFKTDGIKSAYRYYSTKADEVERPYLALYPLRDVSFLQSKAFKSIPVQTNLLPNNGPIFEFADFDTRYYVHLKTLRNPRSSNEPTQYVATVGLEAPSGESELMRKFEEKGLPFQTDALHRVSLYRNYFARQNRLPSGDKKLKEPPKYLAVLELKDPSELEDLTRKVKSDMILASFILIKAYGKTEETYFE